MSDKIKITLVTVALALLWLFIKLLLGFEVLTGFIESIWFVLGLRWTALEIVRHWCSAAPVLEIKKEE